MPRPISWLPRLHDIRKTVTGSVRSHYDRRDLEILFELQPRAAQKLLEVMPTVRVGTSRLVEREVLAQFLERVRDRDDTNGLFDEMRQEKHTVSRRRIRSLVRRDLEAAGLSSLPESIRLSRGHLEVRFDSVEQLAESLLLIARVLQDEGEQFTDAYEPIRPVEPDDRDNDVNAMFADLVRLEADHSVQS